MIGQGLSNAPAEDNAPVAIDDLDLSLLGTRSQGPGTASVEPILFVDLDGTLIKTDLLIETFLVLLVRDFLCLFLVPLWLLRGKAHLKARLAERARFDAALLPYNRAFLRFLHEEAARGRTLVLATACDRALAQKVADHLGIFRYVLASDGTLNMAGERKLEAILRAAGQVPFEYAGNGRVDLHIWPHTPQAILVNPTMGVERAARRIAPLVRVFDDRTRGIGHYLNAMRLHQWLKNLLVFVPLLAAHAWDSSTAVLQAALAFLAFGLLASGIYILNDLLDLHADRAHPRKRERPFAAGCIPLVHGLVLIPVLLAAGLAVASALPPLFMLTAVAYLALTVSYSLRGKIYVLIDVLILAALYTLRVIAGAFAIGVMPSFWLLAFSMFLFLSLALVKRCAELVSLAKAGRPDAKGRDYRADDLATLTSMGTASGYLAALVLAFFINDPAVAARYAYPQGLWLLCPLALYWVSRLWVKTGRGEMNDDPIVFTIRDRGSRFVIVACAAVIVLSTRPLF